MFVVVASGSFRSNVQCMNGCQPTDCYRRVNIVFASDHTLLIFDMFHVPMTLRLRGVSFNVLLQDFVF